MKVTGHQLKAKRKLLEVKRAGLTDQFNSGLTYFPDRDKPDLEQIDLALGVIDGDIVKVEVTQVWYNLHVKVDFMGREVTLAQVIKAKGAYVRQVGRWKAAMGASHVESLRLYGPMVRDPDHIQAEPSVTSSEAVDKHYKAYERLLEIQQSIASANSQVVDIEWLQSLPS